MRLFGTNGIREVVGERLTPAFAADLAGAIGKGLPTGAPIAVGWDGRTSSPGLARIVSGTLALSGHDVVELGLLPTPAFQYNVAAVGAQLGVIVTASHNPPEFNGFKLIAADGLEVLRSVEEGIEASVASGLAAPVAFDRVNPIRQDPAGANRYLHAISSAVDVDRIRKRKFFVVLDCGNGASVVTSPELLRRLGCRVVTLNGQVDGTFPGHPSEPTETNLAGLRAAVPAFGADIGIAHDGDADRCVFVDGAGQFLPGERVLTLFARQRARLNRGGVVVTPVSSSQSVEDVVVPLGGEVVYTRIGSPSVTREMQKRKAIFGGEENGGLIFPELQLARDGAMSAAAMLDLLAREELTLTQAVQDLPTYALRKEKMTLPAEALEAVLAEVGRALAATSSKVVTLDGVKAYREGGWVLVRRSGTEPIIRIFAEAKQPEVADRLIRETLHALEAARTQAKVASR
ncbi:MAG TPA: phosphoglucosamine mutase [Thermoplasmata archaeon]|nr:phosphoglucosamine mutase [Thermoplasmata archaeon]